MVVAYAKTDLGCHRLQNEDVALADARLGMSLVADGVGSRGGGDVAAREASTTIRAVLAENVELLAAGASPQIEAVVQRAFQQADTEVQQSSRVNPDWKGMATTAVLVLAFEDRFLVAHVGDSRAYLVRDGRVHRLTQDHVQAIGPLVEADAPALERALGSGGQPTWSWTDRRPNDLLISCSDGLSDMLRSPKELTLATHFAPADVPDLLIDLARTRDAPDNVAVSVLADADYDGYTLAELRRLRFVPMLSALSLLELAAVRARLVDEELPPHQTIRERQGLAFVSKGRVQITCRGVSRTVSEGGLLGETCATWGGTWPYSARTMEPTTLTFVPEDTLGRILASSPQAPHVLWHLLQDVTEKFIHWTHPEGTQRP